MSRRMSWALLALTAMLAALHLLLPAAPLQQLLRRAPDVVATLLTEVRLPRTLLVLGYGAALGVAGAALQALFSNPLASPDITGSGSGAALAVVASSYWLGMADPMALALAGSIGALAALVMLLALAGRRPSPPHLLIAGLALTLVLGAATSLALALAPSPFAFYDSFDWLMGSFVDKSLAQAAAALAPALVAVALLLRESRALDAMVLGEDVAASLGLRPRTLAQRTIILSSIAIGACVSVCGSIGFVGLIAPMAARRLTGGHPGRAMAPAALLGCQVMLAADLATRLAPDGRPLPVGVLTALAGAPLLVMALRHSSARMTRS